MPETTQRRQLFYSTTEVADLLGCSGEHVRQLVRLGRLKAHDGLGRKILIPCNEVARLTGNDEIPGHEVVSSSRRSETIRELRRQLMDVLTRLDELED